MQEDRIYYKELTCYEKAEEKEKLRSIDGYFDLTKLPTDQMRAEMKRYITQTSHIKNGIRTLKNQYFSL